MLVHPEVYAWLNNQSRSNIEQNKSRPLVTRGEKSNKSGLEKTRKTALYQPDGDERDRREVDYLNERLSNLNLYC